MQDNIIKLQKKINVKFKKQEYLKKAITHKSYDSNNNYEKLEFLGDRILGLIISKKLIELYDKEKEGILDKKLAFLVNKYKCVEVGQELGIEKFILVGNKQYKKNKIENKIISDVVEALIGAIYYDRGFTFTEKFVLKIWKKFIDTSNITVIDSKTKLQEYSLKKYKSLPLYKFISTTGPKHKPEFKIAVKLKATKYYEGAGESKKKAEQNAAKNLLKSLGL
tara:strand:- start:1677 stop:2342 length:666 start_codon:yes stop_codon:yes gene_type:complete